jgi:hypothetical protein
MALLSKYKTLIIVVVLVAIGAVAYTMFLKPNGGVGSLLVAEKVSEEDQMLGNDFVTMLFQLKTVKIEGKIFQDPVFRSFSDFSQELRPEPIGRPNPFAEVGSIASTTISGN